MLAGVGETLPNARLLINPFLRREAVLSSRIEGTISSMTDVLKFEAFEERDAVKSSDVREVANYIASLEEGLRLLADLPVSMRLANKMHERLLFNVRGRDRKPGEVRKHQVWIVPEGGRPEDARFVPPAAAYVPDLLHDWESFLNDDLEMPPLVQCALIHYQFEAIHPYEDGNGRIGRLLIILYLCARGVLPTPLLYLSAFFERNRDAYYDHLLTISLTGEWAPWLEFFLRGVAHEAKDALERSRRLRNLREEYRDRLQKSRQSGNTLRLLDELFAAPIMTAPRAARVLSITPVGARQVLERLINQEIVEVEKEHWPRFYVARGILHEVQ